MSYDYPKDTEQEQEDIRAVVQEVKDDGPLSKSELVDREVGPTTDAELSRLHLTREQQVDRILTGALAAGILRRDSNGDWIYD